MTASLYFSLSHHSTLFYLSLVFYSSKTNKKRTLRRYFSSDARRSCALTNALNFCTQKNLYIWCEKVGQTNHTPTWRSKTTQVSLGFHVGQKQSFSFLKNDKHQGPTNLIDG
jgi:hypothetical protein